LQALTAEAAAEGDYDTVQLLADWGKQLLHLRASGPELPESSTNSPQPHARPGGRQASRKKGPKGAYPRFDRAGEILIKTSWSKKHKKEYQHKAPGAVLSTLLLAFDRAGARNRPITTEAIFPLIADDQSELPSYQAYLALACLKKANAVESRGRDGYQLRIGTRKPRAVAEELWAALPSAK
jgi:hypothetical protein